MDFTNSICLRVEVLVCGLNSLSTLVCLATPRSLPWKSTAHGQEAWTGQLLDRDEADRAKLDQATTLSLIALLS